MSKQDNNMNNAATKNGYDVRQNIPQQIRDKKFLEKMQQSEPNKTQISFPESRYQNFLKSQQECVLDTKSIKDSQILDAGSIIQYSLAISKGEVEDQFYIPPIQPPGSTQLQSKSRLKRQLSALTYSQANHEFTTKDFVTSIIRLNGVKQIREQSEDEGQMQDFNESKPKYQMKSTKQVEWGNQAAVPSNQYPDLIAFRQKQSNQQINQYQPIQKNFSDKSAKQQQMNPNKDSNRMKYFPIATEYSSVNTSSSRLQQQRQLTVSHFLETQVFKLPSYIQQSLIENNNDLNKAQSIDTQVQHFIEPELKPVKKETKPDSNKKQQSTKAGKQREKAKKIQTDIQQSDIIQNSGVEEAQLFFDSFIQMNQISPIRKQQSIVESCFTGGVRQDQQPGVEVSHFVEFEDLANCKPSKSQQVNQNQLMSQSQGFFSPAEQIIKNHKFDFSRQIRQDDIDSQAPSSVVFNNYRDISPQSSQTSSPLRKQKQSKIKMPQTKCHKIEEEYSLDSINIPAEERIQQKKPEKAIGQSLAMKIKVNQDLEESYIIDGFPAQEKKQLPFIQHFVQPIILITLKNSFGDGFEKMNQISEQPKSAAFKGKSISELSPSQYFIGHDIDGLKKQLSSDLQVSAILQVLDENLSCLTNDHFIEAEVYTKKQIQFKLNQVSTEKVQQKPHKANNQPGFNIFSLLRGESKQYQLESPNKIPLLKKKSSEDCQSVAGSQVLQVFDIKNNIELFADNFDKIIGRQGKNKGEPVLVNYIPGQEQRDDQQQKQRLFYINFLIQRQQRIRAKQALKQKEQLVNDKQIASNNNLKDTAPIQSKRFKLNGSSAIQKAKAVNRKNNIQQQAQTPRRNNVKEEKNKFNQILDTQTKILTQRVGKLEQLILKLQAEQKNKEDQAYISIKQKNFKIHKPTLVSNKILANQKKEEKFFRQKTLNNRGSQAQEETLKQQAHHQNNSVRGRNLSQFNRSRRSSLTLSNQVMFQNNPSSIKKDLISSEVHAVERGQNYQLIDLKRKIQDLERENSKLLRQKYDSYLHKGLEQQKKETKNRQIFDKKTKSRSKSSHSLIDNVDFKDSLQLKKSGIQKRQRKVSQQSQKEKKSGHFKFRINCEKSKSKLEKHDESLINKRNHSALKKKMLSHVPKKQEKMNNSQHLDTNHKVQVFQDPDIEFSYDIDFPSIPNPPKVSDTESDLLELASIVFERFDVQINQDTSLSIKKYRNCVILILDSQNTIVWHYDGKFYFGGWLMNYTGNNNGMKRGRGFEFVPDKYLYHGYFQGNNRNGKGAMNMFNQWKYTGEWFNGNKNGYGKQKDKQSIYQGFWKDNKKDGHGAVKSLTNQYRYTGNFLKGVKNGQGQQHFENGDSYKGNYFNGKFHGNGIYIWANGARYEGQFMRGSRHGKGSWKSGQRGGDFYQGQYYNNMKNGFGIYKWADGSLYHGQFQNDLQSGKGKMITATGEVIQGYWRNGSLIDSASKGITSISKKKPIRISKQKVLQSLYSSSKRSFSSKPKGKNS